MELGERLHSSIEKWIIRFHVEVREEEGVVTQREWEDQKF